MMVTGGAAVIGGAITQCVTWIGALTNTFRAPDKTWFVVLLALGLIGFQFPVMIAYLVVGSDARALVPTWSTPVAPPLPPPPAPGHPPPVAVTGGDGRPSLSSADGPAIAGPNPSRA